MRLYGEFVFRFLVVLLVLLAPLNTVLVLLDADTSSGWRALLASLCVLYVTAWGEASMVEDIRDHREATGDVGFFQLLARTWRVAIRVAWATFLVALIVAVVFVVFLLFADLFVVGFRSSVVALALSAAPALFLLARWSLLVPAIVIERKGTSAAFARSTELVIPRRWMVTTVVLTGIGVGLGLDLVLATAAERFTSGWIEAWLVQLADGVVYASLVTVVSTALYLELTGTGSRRRTPLLPHREDAHGWGDLGRLR